MQIQKKNDRKLVSKTIAIIIILMFMSMCFEDVKADITTIDTLTGQLLSESSLHDNQAIDSGIGTVGMLAMMVTFNRKFFQSSKVIQINNRHCSEHVTCYIHKSDGKKREGLNPFE